MLTIVAGALLGWGLGANDAANVFGTAVSSRMVTWRKATILASFFIVLGAVLQGAGGVNTLSGIGESSLGSAGISALAAALTMALMTGLRLPVSASQAVVGALVGVGLVNGHVDLVALRRVVLCWIGTPIGGMVLAIVFYHLLRVLIRVAGLSIFSIDPFLYYSLLLCGCYGAYALGANNVANVASFFAVHASVSPQVAVFVGGLTIASGVLTYSRGVMMTVGKGVTPLDAFSALVVVLSQAVTVHVYAVIGVPVSTSQAVIGAVLGIGTVKGIQIINWNVLAKVIGGWFATPLVSGIIGYLLWALLTGRVAG